MREITVGSGCNDCNFACFVLAGVMWANVLMLDFEAKPGCVISGPPSPDYVPHGSFNASDPS